MRRAHHIGPNARIELVAAFKSEIDPKVPSGGFKQFALPFWRFGQIFPSMVQPHATRFTLSKMRTLIFITFGVAVVIGVGPVPAADRDIISVAQLEGVTEPNCATRLKGFIIDIDDLLAQSPRDITDVNAVIYRYFPLRSCDADEVSRIVKTSKYFRSVSMNGPKTRVFSLNSETAFSRGVSVTFGLTDGETHLPFAIWSPPFW